VLSHLHEAKPPTFEAPPHGIIPKRTGTLQKRHNPHRNFIKIEAAESIGVFGCIA
jgi:hypothetical protein